MELEKIKKFFEDDRLAKYLNITITEAEKGMAKCVMDIDKNLLNANDFVHGGALFSLADFTFAVAANAELIGQNAAEELTQDNTGGSTDPQPTTPSQSTVVSQSVEIKYIKPATGNRITAIAKFKSRIGVKSKYTVEIFDESETLVAIVTAKGHLLSIPAT